jgi:hypothetical protein
MMAWVHPANQSMTEGQSAFEAVKFSGAAKAKRRRSPGVDPPFIGKSTSYPCLPAGLVALRQTFVRRCHGGLGSSGPAGIGKSEHDGRAVRLGAMRF